MRLREFYLASQDKSVLSQSFLPRLNVSTTNITSQSHLQNQKYSKTFEVLQSTEISHIPKLSKVKIRPHHCKFDKIVEKLDIVAKESRFPNKRITLIEDSLSKGFIDEGSYQAFEVNVRDFFSPLKVKITMKKGKIQTFVSFNNPRPDKYSCDKFFETLVFEIHSLSPIFIEYKCYLNVFALLGSSIKIQISFGGSAIYKRAKVNDSFSKTSKVLSYDQHIKNLRENPDMRSEFNAKVEKLLEDRKINSKSNFIEKNKSLEKSMTLKQDLDFKIKKVQAQKQIIQKSKSELKLALLNKHHIKSQVENESQKLKVLIWFRKYFEETWLKLIYNFLFLGKLQSEYIIKRKLKQFGLLCSMQAYKIQKNFYRTYPAGFTIKYRQMAITRNSLLLYRARLRPMHVREVKAAALKTIQSVSHFKAIPYRIKLFHRCAIRIQRHWREWKGFYESLMQLFIRFWDKTNDGLINTYAGNSKLKKKRKAVILEKLGNISEEVKKQCVKNYLYECRINFLNTIKRSQSMKDAYPRDKEKFKVIILGLCETRNKTLKKNATLVSDKHK